MGDSSKFQGTHGGQREEDDKEAREPKIFDPTPRGLWQQLDGREPVHRQRPQGMWDLINARASEPVQRKPNGEPNAEDPRSVASAGVQSATERLPHHDRIQASFGRHDISQVRAHTGGPAAEASRGLGASAYAVGDRVGFSQSPDLHTAAHEAAHVVQQRAGVQLKGGIDGGTSDSYEQHANAVADKVVRGESAEGMLDGMAPQSGARDPAGGDVVQRAPDESRQAPGASITVSLFDKNKAFITSRSEPLYSEGAQGSYIGEVQGDTVKWDGGSIDVKLGSKVEAGGKLSGAMSVGAWAKQAGHGRAAYVLIEVDAAELRTKDQNPDAKPWANDDAAGAKGGPKPAATGKGADPNATTSHVQPGQGGASDGSGGTADKTVAGMQDAGDHTGTSAIQNGEKGGTRVMGQRSKGEGEGTRHGKKGAEKRDVGYFWDPDRQHEGTQDTAPDGADKDGMVGGAGKHGDHGIPDVGAWKAKIPIPKRFAAAATAAMILYQANIQQIAKDLVKAAEKTAEAELKAFALQEIEKLTGTELRHLAEKGVFEGMDDAALAAAREDLRSKIVQQLTTELDAELANAEKAAAIDRANMGGDSARYAADDLKEEVKEVAAAKKARSAVPTSAERAPQDGESVAQTHGSDAGQSATKQEPVTEATSTHAKAAESGHTVGPHPGATAQSPVAKFRDYIFKPGQMNGKNAIFEGLGYAREDSERLAAIWEQQGAEAFRAGRYTLGTLDQYGQRISIEIVLSGVGKFASKTAYLRSGWMILEDGSIKLNTPFSGFTR